MLGATGGISYATFANQLRSYTKHRTQKKQEFVTSDYASASIGPFTSRIKLHLGNEYVDPRSSYLQFDVKMLYGQHLVSNEIQFKIDPHPIVFIKTLTVYDAHGKVISQVDHLNKVMIQHLSQTHDLNFLKNQYSWQDHVMNYTKDDDYETLQIPNGSTTATKHSEPYRCIIPLYFLGGIFDVNNLLPPQLCNNLIIDIEWENPANVFLMYSEETRDWTSWARVRNGQRLFKGYNNFLNDDLDKETWNHHTGSGLINYELNGMFAMLDTYEIESKVHAEMSKTYANEGFHIRFKTFTNQKVESIGRFDDFVSDIEFPGPDQLSRSLRTYIHFTQSVSNAERFNLFCWPGFKQLPFEEAEGNLYTKDDYAIDHPIWWSARMAQLCTSYSDNFSNYLRSYRVRVHNHHTPQFPVVLKTWQDPQEYFDGDERRLYKQWKKSQDTFLQAIAYDTNRKAITTTTVDNYVPPLSVPLHRSFYAVNVPPQLPDMIRNEGVKINFNHPLVLELEAWVPRYDRLVVHQGKVTFSPLRYEEEDTPPTTPPTFVTVEIPPYGDFEARASALEFDWFRYWNDIVKVYPRVLFSVEHSVDLHISAKENTVRI